MQHKFPLSNRWCASCPKTRLFTRHDNRTRIYLFSRTCHALPTSDSLRDCMFNIHISDVHPHSREGPKINYTVVILLLMYIESNSSRTIRALYAPCLGFASSNAASPRVNAYIAPDARHPPNANILMHMVVPGKRLCSASIFYRAPNTPPEDTSSTPVSSLMPRAHAVSCRHLICSRPFFVILRAVPSFWLCFLQGF